MEERSGYNAEIDFKELLGKPHRLIGVTYFYFLGVLILVGVLYVNNLNAVGQNAVLPVVLKDSSAFVQDIPFRSPGVLPPVDARVAAIPTDSLIAHGRDLYRAQCASCHGDNGQGDGAAGLVLNPKPRNFHVGDGWTNGARITQMYKTLQEGIVQNGMASYGYLPPADRFALIHYIRKFVPAAPLESEEEILGLETVYQLSKGSVIAAQIPVGDATRRIVAEQAASVAASRQWSERLPASAAEDPGAALFSHVASDPERALTALRAARTQIAPLDQFVRLVASDPVQLGFRTSVMKLSRDEWATLHQYVLIGTL